MKLVEMKCKNCGAVLKINDEQKDIDCQYCHAKYKLDDEVQHIKYDDMEQSGYEFEKGRIRAQKEQKNNNVNYNYTNKKNNKTLWLVLAWIFLLPFMATYYIIKSEKLDKKKKIIIIAIMWAVFLIIAYTNPSDNTNNSINQNTNTTQNENQPVEASEEEKYAEDAVVNEFIKSFKNQSSMELNDIKKGNIRTKYYVHINGKYVELLNATGQPANFFEIVIYGNGKTDEEIEAISNVYKEIVKILDPTISEENLNNTIDTYIKPKETTRKFDLNEKINVNYYPSSGAGGYDCRIEINTTQYNK